MDRRHFFVICFGLAVALIAGEVCSSGESVQPASERGEGTGPPATSKEPPSPLYMLTYDHGGVVLWGPDHFLERLRNAVEWLDRYPSFKIGLDNEAYTYDYLGEHNPEVLKELRGYLKRYSGRFGIGTCTYGQPLSQFINEESNVRQIAYAIEADREHLGYAPTVYLMSEHAMHSQIPQLLVGFGFSGAIMRTHFMMYGYNPTFDVATGWWVGLDGSRIPAVPTYEGEGAEFGRTTVDNWILTRYPGPECSTPLEEFRKKFARIGPLLASRADDSKLRREELVKKYEDNREYRWVLLEEIFPTFPAPTEELKTGPNDFHVRMPWGYCGNEIWNVSRSAEVQVLTAERLAAMELLLGGADHQNELRQAWKNLLVAQHHDIQICGLLKEANRFLPASMGLSGRVRDASLRYIASRMEGGDTAQLTVFNPVSWPRKEWTEVAVSLNPGAARAVMLRHGAKPVPSALLAASRHPDGSIKGARLAVLIDVPGLAFASYSLSGGEEVPVKLTPDIQTDVAGLRVTTAEVEIVLNPEGGVSSLVDRRSGRSLLKSDRRSCFFAGKIDGRDCESKGSWAIEQASEGQSWVVARERGSIADIPYTLEMTIRPDSPRLDCRASFHFNGQKIGRLSEDRRDSKSAFLHEEKLRVKLFPAPGDDAVGVRDLPFAVAESTERYVEGNYWTALAGRNGGVAVFNRGTMGSVRETDGGFSVPVAYAMYYVWGTRMLNGDFTYEFALYPFSGDWREAELHRRALEYNFPCVVACAAPGDGRLGNEVRPLEIASPDVILSALYSHGGRIYARMYEHRGRGGRVSLSYLLGRARLTEADLAEQKRQEVSSSLDFRPWQIKTIRIEPLK
jgi:alpha-mannosidase